MDLAAGTTLGPYEILSPIGSGAMGDVYRARDTRLDRDVAIKVLPPVFARDPDRLGRFEREARAVAAINHPNILAVHDIGSADLTDSGGGTVRATYMITELLDGDTLRARLAQGPLAARKSIDVATQVARGLAAAHDRGIIHRDLKPENIVLLRDGHVKILDFGLAKQVVPDRAGSGEQQTMAATDAGTVLGTVGYMAPEQVRGEPADSRSDLFALGAVLYELASGQRAFARPTAAETMTAVLRDDPPDLSGTSAGLSPALDRVVRHALEKDPGDRFQSARDFAFALQALSGTGSSGGGAAPGATPRRPLHGREMAAWTLAGLLAVAAAAGIWWPHASAPATTAAPVIFAAAPPRTDAVLDSPSVAPDGQRVAFIAHGRADDSIVIRQLGSVELTVLKGTAGARTGSVFWSPDGRSIGFFAGGKLKVLELGSGKIDDIADAPSAFGGAWGPDGTILFSPDERAPIFRVNARGGAAAPVTTLDAARHDQAHRWPQFLPDGRHFTFMPWNSGTTRRAIQLGSLDGAPPRTLFEAPTTALVVGTFFLYAREEPGNLMAQAFDPGTLELVGRPVPVVTDDNVDFSWFTGDPLASASASTLVYTTAKLRPSQLTWFGRTGQALGRLGEPAVYYDPAISPDGTTLVIEKRAADGATDLWTVDLARSVFSRLTSLPGFESVGTWSGDGRRIAFGADQGQSAKIYVKNANGTGTEEAITDSRSFPIDWSRDGRYLTYLIDGGATRLDTWVYDSERKTSTPLLISSFNETLAKFSPDGKWIAYVSDETGSRQVYVRSFPDGGTKVRVSSGGGNQPEWRRNGQELFYLAPDSTLMSVAVRESGTQFAIVEERPLFQTNAEQDRAIRNHYTASPDGQRFLVLSPLVDPNASPLVAVLNWTAGLKR